ncbi:GTPase [Candidatus Vidania fulgoroideorum]
MKKAIIAIITNKSSSLSIIRISMGDYGFMSNKIKKIIFLKKYLFPRLATKVNIFIKEKKIDTGIVIYFPEPKSFNGETIFEINTHSINVSYNIVNYLKKTFKFIRNAKKGEFTYRGFLNKKISLLDVNDINNKINLENRNYIYRIQNEKNFLKLRLEKINRTIIKIRIFLENLILKEEEIGNYDKLYIKKKIILLKKIIGKIKFKSFRIFKICVIGNTNVGKSTFFNKILKKNISITSKSKCTTTNFLKKKIIIDRFKFLIYDTAGFVKKKNNLEKKCIKKTINLINKSDLILKIVDIKNIYKSKSYKNEILIFNKIDNFNRKIKKKIKGVFISAKMNNGIKNIYKIILKKYIDFEKNNYLNKKIYKIYIFFKKILKKKINIDILSENLKILNRKMNCFLNNKEIVKIMLKKFCIGK